jgi:hypothetical protein
LMHSSVIIKAMGVALLRALEFGLQTR